MEKKLKPFDLEAAKSGAPVITRDGRPARIIYSEAKSIYNIIALVEDGGDERPISVATDGVNGLGPSNNDLFMVSVKHEGWVNLYRDSSGSLFTSLVRDTKEKALSSITAQSDCYVTTTRIEWEE